MFDKIAFGILLKKKRGKRFSQGELADLLWGKDDRKGEISRYENGKTAPNEETLTIICEALEITDAEMVPIRSGGVHAAQLDQIPTLSRDQLELLATRFEIPSAHARPDADLRRLLTQKAEEYRQYRDQINSLDERVPAIANLKGAAQDAAQKFYFDEVETLLSRVDEVETEIAAETKLARARNALLRNRPDDAARILTAAANSFASVDQHEQASKLNTYASLLCNHGLNYGGTAMAHSAAMWQQAATIAKALSDVLNWAGYIQNLGNALVNLATRSDGDGDEAITLFNRAITTFEDALTITTKTDHPVEWATTTQNLGNSLTELAKRSDGDEAIALFNRAITAYEDALTILTKNDHPFQWAMIQENLALTHAKLALHSASNAPQSYLQTALTHIDHALDGYDPQHIPFYHQQATATRDRIIAALREVD